MEIQQTITQEDINNFILSRPHVFILGAGASKAAIPNGDRNGMDSPLMDGFIEKAGLNHIVSYIPLKTKSNNLEDIYSELYASGKYKQELKELEKGICGYFRKLLIPYAPTIYDYLLLSLRSKDFIFSFNWDDLIVQAYLRVSTITKNLPKLYFLHGNVAMGYCDCCPNLYHIADKFCPKCHRKLKQQSILYPITNKNYEKDKSISNAWDDFLIVLQSCSILTIFGYGAPPSDSAAIEKMSQAFSKEFRKLDKIEIIDLKDEQELIDNWAPFLEPANYHVKCYKDFFDSIISEFPRRTVEGYCKRNNNWFGPSTIRLKPNLTFEELEELIMPMLQEEAKGNFDTL